MCVWICFFSSFFSFQGFVGTKRKPGHLDRKYFTIVHLTIVFNNCNLFWGRKFIEETTKETASREVKLLPHLLFSNVSNCGTKTRTEEMWRQISPFFDALRQISPPSSYRSDVCVDVKKKNNKKNAAVSWELKVWLHLSKLKLDSPKPPLLPANRGAPSWRCCGRTLWDDPNTNVMGKIISCLYGTACGSCGALKEPSGCNKVPENRLLKTFVPWREKAA